MVNEKKYKTFNEGEPRLLTTVLSMLHTINKYKTNEMNVVNMNLNPMYFQGPVCPFVPFLFFYCWSPGTILQNSPRACLRKFAFYDYVLEKLRLPKYEIIHLNIR